MFYDVPASRQVFHQPKWPIGVGSISARLPEGDIVDIPVLKGVNCLTLGVVGTGKTVSYTKPAARLLLESNPRMKGVFFEVKRTFIDSFSEPGDKVITHNPTAVPTPNLFIPNLIREVHQAEDKEAEMREIADFLFAELMNGANQNRAWIEAARNTFIAVIRTIVDCYPDANTGNGTLINSLRKMTSKDILTYIAKHPRNHSIILRDWDCDPYDTKNYTPTRRSSDIQFFLNQVLEMFTGSFAMDGNDTIHNWLNGDYGQNLFFLYDLKSAEISRAFFLYYLKKIKDYKMSNGISYTSPVLMVLDEIDKMADGGKSADFGLFQAATLGRECGLQILLTSQSLENLYGLAPDFNQHITNGGLAGFPNIFCFRLGDPLTIAAMQTLYGSEYKEHIVLPASRYSDAAVNCEKEPIVSDEEFASLGVGDCIVKIMSHKPQRVHINT